MRYWRVSFNGCSLAVLTPLFLFDISYGDKHFLKSVYWWGFLFCWSKNKSAKEGDLLFNKEKWFVFREYSQTQAIIYGGLPL